MLPDRSIAARLLSSFFLSPSSKFPVLRSRTFGFKTFPPHAGAEIALSLARHLHPAVFSLTRKLLSSPALQMDLLMLLREGMRQGPYSENEIPTVHVKTAANGARCVWENTASSNPPPPPPRARAPPPPPPDLYLG